jgi:hypothetical protein
MTQVERRQRIRELPHELAMLLEEESGAPLPTIRLLTAADVPEWVRHGLAEAIRRKVADEEPTKH